MDRNNENLALQEIVRRIHPKLSAKFIKANSNAFFTLPTLTSISYAKILADVCESHTESYDWIRTNLNSVEVFGGYRVNPQFLAAILRLADILDIDSSRTPFILQQAINPTGASQSEWAQHFVISNTNKIEKNAATNVNRIAFHGQCSAPAIHRKILGYIEWVESEITNAFQLLSTMLPQYVLNFETKPIINIRPDGYVFADKKMTLNFKAITRLLMGEKIYGSADLGLREIIQNAIDSCCIRKEIEDSLQTFGCEAYEPKIKVFISPTTDTVVISDNGMGMTLETINNHFLNVGSSLYSSRDFLLSDFSYKPIGNFGIGFLACFMLSKTVQVTTRHYKEKMKHTIELESGVEYTSLNSTEDILFQGTEIRLNYKEFISAFNGKHSEVASFLSLHFLTDPVTIQVIDQDAQERHEIKNSLCLPVDNQGKRFAIDLSKYLTGIRGYAVVRKHQSYIREIKDIDFMGDVYVYDNEQGILPIEDCTDINLSDFYANDQFSYYTIPLVTSDMRSDFDVGLEYTGGDIDQVIDKHKDNMEWVSILIPNSCDEWLLEEVIDEHSRMLENFHFSDLIDLGQSAHYQTKIFKRSIKMFESKRDSLYVPFAPETPSNPYWKQVFEKKLRLYVRKVYVKDFTFKAPLIASVFEIESIVANVEARDIIPDISRNKLGAQDSVRLNYAIFKAIHMGASREIELSTEEQNALYLFASNYYSTRTQYELISYKE